MCTRPGSVLLCTVGARIASTLALALGSFPIVAQDDAGFYAGAGISGLDFKDEHDGIAYDDSVLGWQVFGGYQLNHWLAAELAGKRFSDIKSGEIVGSGTEQLEIAAEFEVLVLRGMLIVSLEDVMGRSSNAEVFATAGYFDAETAREVVQLGASQSTTVTYNESGLALGGGVLYRFPRFVLRGYLEWLDGDDDRNPLDAGVAIEYRF